MHVSYVTSLRCLSCRRTVDSQPFRYFCPTCGGYLDVEYDYSRMRADLAPAAFEGRRGSIMEQWQEFLPIERPDLIASVTLGERPTPMIPARRLPPPADRAQVWLKDDTRFPTCSLKDRSMPLAVLKALELGYRAVGIVSSGNAAASLAAYAARAGLKAIVFLRAGAPINKLYKTLMYAPVLLQVNGPYEVAEELFQQARDEFGFFDCNGLVNPYRCEGKKTFAYEVARDLGWCAPSAVFLPAGYGNGVTAAWKGFQELHRLGFISSLPAIVAVQPAVCAPIARAFDLGLPKVEAVPQAESIADAVVVANPVVGGQRVLEAVRASGGRAVAVSEDEIMTATRLLAEREGLSCEPTGAIALAGFLKVMREGNPWLGGPQIVALTGHSLNDQRIGSILGLAATQVEATPEAVRAALGRDAEIGRRGDAVTRG